jgi:hypothetical protein
MPETKERPLGELFAELTRDTATLIRKELELAKLELMQKVSVASRHAAMLAVGGFIVYAGVLALVAALVMVLVAAGVNPALSALIVGAVVLAIGGVLVQRSLTALSRVSFVPDETIRTVKETTQWMKSQTH